MTMNFLECWPGILLRILLIWDLSVGFLMIRLCFEEEDHRGKVPFLPHLNKGICHQHDLC